MRMNDDTLDASQNGDINDVEEATSSLPAGLHWYHWLVVFGSIILTLSAWYVSSQQTIQKRDLHFDIISQQYVKLVKERMQKYEDALWGGIAAIHALPSRLSADQWKIYSETLSLEEKYPGINGIGVIYYLPPSERQEFLTRERKDRPYFNIHPPHTIKEFWPITFIEPEDINRKAVGLDMAHEVNRYTAAKKARDEAIAQITAPIILVQDSQKTPGFLFYAPFYETVKPPELLLERKKKFEGIVYAPFIMKNLMDGTLTNTNRLVNFSIQDGDNILYDEFSNESIDFDPKPLLSKTIEANLYGRPWTFNIKTTKLFREQHSSAQPTMILAGGIVIDIMLFSLFVVLGGSHKRALKYADRLTQDLQINKSKLETTYNRLTSALNTMVDGLLIISERGTIEDANKAALEIFKYSRNELIHRNVRVLLANSRNQADVGVMSSISNWVGEIQSLQAVKSDGVIFTAQVLVTQGNTENGVFYTCIIRDITLQIEKDNQLAKQSALLDASMGSAPTQFIIINHVGKIIDVNQTTCDSLGYSREQLLTLTLSDISNEDSELSLAKLLVDLFSESADTIRQEREFICRDGQRYWGLLTANKIQSGSEGMHGVLNIIDIQQEKSLSLELTERNAALEFSNEELNQFAFITSHDLKEPMRTLRVFLGYLLKDLHSGDLNKVNEDVQFLEGAAERMTHLIDDLLLLSRTSSDELMKEPVNIESLVHSTLKNLKTLIEETASVFHLDFQISEVQGDRVLLGQSIQNLIENAIKFHKQDEHPIIKVVMKLSEDQSSTILEIADNGVGIPEAHLGNIFLAFKKLHSVEDYSGTGIGLSIVKKTLDRHNATIEVSSTVDVGTTFRLTFPNLLDFEKSASPAHNQSPPEAHHG